MIKSRAFLTHDSVIPCILSGVTNHLPTRSPNTFECAIPYSGKVLAGTMFGKYALFECLAEKVW